MAVVFLDGFDTYNGTGTGTGLQSGWTFINGSTSSSLQTGRFGGQCYQMSTDASNNRGVTTGLPAAYSTVTIGCAFRVTSMPAVATDAATLGVRNSTTPMCGIRIESGGVITAGRYTGITARTDLGSSLSGVISTNVWYWLEVTFTISDTVGAVSVNLNGTNVLNLTNVDTRNGTPTTVDTLIMSTTSAVSGTYQFDDMYVVDNATPLGDRRIVTLYPSADVSQGFARSTGAVNYSLVNEAQVDGDTSYVQGGLSDLDRYDLDNLGLNPSSIDAAQVVAYAQSTDAYARRLALQIKSGATVSDGTDFGLSAGSYGKLKRLMLVNPATGVAFTSSEIDALQGGPKVTV